MEIEASPVVSIGHVANENTVSFVDYREATQAWLMLARMGVPAALSGGRDGWLPNNRTTAWHQTVIHDFRVIPDISLSREGDLYHIKSVAMCCEFRRKERDAWKLIAETITEYRARLESGCRDANALTRHRP